MGCALYTPAVVRCLSSTVLHAHSMAANWTNMRGSERIADHLVGEGSLGGASKFGL